MREIVFKNDTLLDLLNKNTEIHLQSVEINKKIEDLQQEQVKLGYKSEKIKDKMIPFVQEKEKEAELGEFEYVYTFNLDENDNTMVKLTIRDRIEDMQEFYREEKLKKTNESNDSNPVS